MALWITKEDVSAEYKQLGTEYEEVNSKLEAFIAIAQNDVLSDLDGIIDASELLLMQVKPVTVLRLVRMSAQIKGLTFFYQNEDDTDNVLSGLRDRYKDLIVLLRSGDMIIHGTTDETHSKGGIEIG